jgi:hypothetical protein
MTTPRSQLVAIAQQRAERTGTAFDNDHTVLIRVTPKTWKPNWSLA